MKKTTPYIAVRLGILAFFLLLAGIGYEFLLYPQLLKKEGWLKELGARRFHTKPDVLYFSASPNASSAPADSDKRSISEMAQAELPGIRIGAFDTGAVHAGIFRHALQHLPAGYTPKLIVMDLNLRSFGPQWIHSSLENSLQRNVAFWNDRPGLINRMNVVLKNYPFILDHERREIIYYDEKFADLPFGNTHRTIRLWADSLFRTRSEDPGAHEMIVHFGFRIRPGNWMLQQYDAIVSYCRSQNIPLVFVVLPENIRGMETRVGKDLGDLCRMNVDFLEKHFARQHVTVVDLSEQLPPEVFFEPFPTEHYTAQGRSLVARAMADIIHQTLK